MRMMSGQELTYHGLSNLDATSRSYNRRVVKMTDVVDVNSERNLVISQH